MYVSPSEVYLTNLLFITILSRKVHPLFRNITTLSSKLVRIKSSKRPILQLRI